MPPERDVPPEGPDVRAVWRAASSFLGARWHAESAFLDARRHAESAFLDARRHAESAFLDTARGEPAPTRRTHASTSADSAGQPTYGRSRPSSSRAIERRWTASGPSTMRSTRAQA